MNPDHFDNLKTTYTTWILIDSDGNTVSFKVLNNGGSVTITQESGGSFMVSREDARKHWNRYMDNGYRISNKSTEDKHFKNLPKESIRSKYDVGAKAAAAEYKKVMEDIGILLWNALIMHLRLDIC